MNNNLAVHHHFFLLEALIKNPLRFNGITFKSIPFFKLYSWSSYNFVQQSLHTLTAPLPHKYQKIYQEIKPPEYLENACYRQELDKLNYCVYNRKGYFVRAYYLRQNGGNFFKVEITLHSETLGTGKYYNWEKALRAAEDFFKLLDQAVDLSPVDIHVPDFFTIEHFNKEVSLQDNSLNQLHTYRNKIVRGRLIRKQGDVLKSFQKDAKKLAAIYIQSYRRGREPPS